MFLQLAVLHFSGHPVLTLHLI